MAEENMVGDSLQGFVDEDDLLGHTVLLTTRI